MRREVAFIVFALLLTVLTGGCSPIIHVQHDYDTDVDFAGLYTFDWMRLCCMAQQGSKILPATFFKKQGATEADPLNAFDSE